MSLLVGLEDVPNVPEAIGVALGHLLALEEGAQESDCCGFELDFSSAKTRLSSLSNSHRGREERR